MTNATWDAFTARATAQEYTVTRTTGKPLTVHADSIGSVVAMLSRRSVAWVEIN